MSDSANSNCSDLPDYSSSSSVYENHEYPSNIPVDEEASCGYELGQQLEHLKWLEEIYAHIIDAGSDPSSYEDRNMWDTDPFEDVEDIRRYGPGGYHPILIGDFLGPLRRFRVAHKLGYGYFGTVWLCYDNQESLWRAVKVLTAESSYPNCPELVAMERLSNTAPEHLINNHLGVPMEYFWIDGPNGRHLCLVIPLLGPKIRGESNDTSDVPNQLSELEENNPQIYADISFQVSRALNFMHNKGLCHGGRNLTTL
jgi:hypothetical protein